MKLFYFSGSTIPSSYANSVHVMKMCAAFARLGHDVTLFGKGAGGKDVFASYDVPKNFKLVLCPSIHIPKIGGFIRLVFTMLKAKFLGPPDLVYGRDLWTISLMTHKKTPIMLELHEIPEAASTPAKLLRKILGADNLLGVTVISEGLKRDLLQFFPYAEDKILVVHDGADVPVGEIEPAKLAPLDKTTFQIGYGGSLYPGKGVELMISIAKILPNVGFHICGGPDGELKKWTALELPANIIFYGHMDQKSLKSHLSACDALIAPYMPQIHINTGVDISRWISPLKLFEYMAMKKPILCSDLPVLRETMEHNNNALLALPDDLQGWSNNIERIKNDENLSKNLASHAYKKLEEQYSWAVRGKNILSFMQSLS